jgi:hypothetical protein
MLINLPSSCPQLTSNPSLPRTTAVDGQFVVERCVGTKRFILHAEQSLSAADAQQFCKDRYGFNARLAEISTAAEWQVVRRLTMAVGGGYTALRCDRAAAVQPSVWDAALDSTAEPPTFLPPTTPNLLVAKLHQRRQTVCIHGGRSTTRHHYSTAIHDSRHLLVPPPPPAGLLQPPLGGPLQDHALPQRHRQVRLRRRQRAPAPRPQLVPWRAQQRR